MPSDIYYLAIIGIQVLGFGITIGMVYQLIKNLKEGLEEHKVSDSKNFFILTEQVTKILQSLAYEEGLRKGRTAAQRS